MSATAVKTTYSCGVCGKRISADAAVYSRHTNARYCRDLVGCARRAKRRGRPS